MNDKQASIMFDTDDGQVEFFVLEQTMLGGINYILVTEDSDEGTFLILKENSDLSDGELASYEIVEDDNELEAVIKVFDQLLEDFDLEV